jgi:transposase InsO family protein
VQLNEQRLHTVWQQKLYVKLAGLQYRIIYKKGCDNMAADALSRVPTEGQVMHISQGTPLWIQGVVASYNDDPQAQELLTKLSVSATAAAPYTLSQGIIRYKGRVWLGSSPDIQRQIISALHDSPIGGHSGFPVTYSRIKHLFYWKGMKQAVRNYVQSCSTCQQAKPDRSRYPGLLAPLPVPPHAWHSISMDFIEGLPRSGTVDCILVVVDRFSKYGHFLALSHPFSAPKVAKLFLDQVYRLHGMPDNIVSDRDRVFTSAFWQQLFTLSGTQLCMSSSYHPQSDGQTERVNQCIETYLRCFVHACPSKWSHWLPLAEFWYNTNSHASLDRSPFEVLYGHPPKHFGLHHNSAILVTDLDQWMQEREVVSKLVQQHLLRAQSRMKKYADQHRSERVFSVGDRVYLKLQPYVQSSVTRRSNQKLAFRYFGPYTISQRVGAAAYKLQLPDSAQIHPVFHVSQLKAVISRHQVVTASLPVHHDALQIPIQVLQSRLIQKGGATVAQVKVLWSGMDESLATWEDLKALKDRFPHAPAWGQAAFQERGNVSTDTQDNVGAGNKAVGEPGARELGGRAPWGAAAGIPARREWRRAMGGSRPWELSKKKARVRYGYWPSSGGKKITDGR